ncbi:MAG: biopolymer transporter ExbD [Candidatus Cloacimonadales bacterium]
MKLTRRKKVQPEANMSSSSDIAFLLLLFFVVTTQIIYIPVQTKYPNAREIERQMQSNILTVYIGNDGTSPHFDYYLDDIYVNELVDRKNNEEFSKSLGRQIKSRMDQDPDRNWLISLRIDADIDFDTINTLITDLQNNKVEAIVFEARKRG